jgi:thiaminase
MSFYQTLLQATEQDRQYLLGAPIIARCFHGDISRDDYVAFLTQAYHHVKHTVPLLMSVGALLPEAKEWLREAVAEYIEEELGHQEWILNDIKRTGYDKEMARRSTPSFATEMMVSYAYDTVRRVNPVGFFGMVLVLEGTSTALAENAAETIAAKLQLPKSAFSYLTSHGALDQDHIKFYENLMNKIDDPADQAVIIHAAKRFYRLYGDIFRTLTAEHGIARLPEAAATEAV